MTDFNAKIEEAQAFLSDEGDALNKYEGEEIAVQDSVALGEPVEEDERVEDEA